mmetsp:Transcript_14060/g.30525  ORF Transcript_14060/g.30525 Transcript_14060/m.30525 type:complete len:383 (+) Transcript_14060:1741-2889(+)
MEDIRVQHVGEKQNLHLHHVVADDVALGRRMCEVTVPGRFGIRARGIEEPARPLPPISSLLRVGLVISQERLHIPEAAPPWEPRESTCLKIRVDWQCPMSGILHVWNCHQHISQEPDACPGSALDNRRYLVHRCHSVFVWSAVDTHAPHLLQQLSLLLADFGLIAGRVVQHVVQQFRRQLLAAGGKTAQVVEQRQARSLRAAMVGSAQAEHVRDWILPTLRSACAEQWRLAKDRVCQRDVALSLCEEAGEGAPAVQDGVVEAGAPEPVGNVRVRLSCQKQLASLVMPLGGCIEQRSVVRLRVIGDHRLHRCPCIQQQSQCRGCSARCCEVYGSAGVGDAPSVVVGTSMHICRRPQNQPQNGLWLVAALLFQADGHVDGEVNE